MQQATRVSDRTAFFSVLTDSKNDTRTGILVEYGPTQQIFEDPRTAAPRPTSPAAWVNAAGLSQNLFRCGAGPPGDLPGTSFGRFAG